MDFKEIAKKVIEGGNADEITSTLSDKDKGEVWKEVAQGRKVIADAELAVIEARRKERQRIETDTQGTQNQAAEAVKAQMRSEQIEIALNIAEERLKSKGITLTPEAKVKLKEDFRPFDTGKFDATLIVSDFLRAYGASNYEKLLEDSSQRANAERQAAEFTSGGASGGSAGGGSAGTPTLAPEVRDMIRAAQSQGITLTKEQAERGMKAGQGWRTFEAKPPKS